MFAEETNRLFVVFPLTAVHADSAFVGCVLQDVVKHKNNFHLSLSIYC